MPEASPHTTFMLTDTFTGYTQPTTGPVMADPFDGLFGDLPAAAKKEELAIKNETQRQQQQQQQQQRPVPPPPTTTRRSSKKRTPAIPAAKNVHDRRIRMTTAEGQPLPSSRPH